MFYCLVFVDLTNGTSWITEIEAQNAMTAIEEALIAQGRDDLVVVAYADDNMLTSCWWDLTRISE